MGGGLWDDEGPEDGDDGEGRKRGTEPVEARGVSEVPGGEDGEKLMRELARSHVELAIRTLADVSTNGDKDAARVASSRELLARGFGSVVKKSEQKVDVKITDQRAAHFAALQHMAEKNPVLDIEDAEFDEIPNTRRIADKRRRDDD